MKTLSNILKYLFLVLMVSTVVVSIVGVLVFAYFSKGLPNIITSEDYRPLVVTKVISKDGVVVGEFFEERRYVVQIDQIPTVVQKAFISAEDDRFFEHQGIDLHGIVRAAIVNFKAGRVVQGGSTITQQVAKSLLLTPERSFFRKIREIILAHRMEKDLSKNQILLLYLNQIYLGQGAYGVEAAAKVYFNKSAKDLTIAEAALLAGLPQAPSKYSPLGNPKQAKQRQNYVLRRMFENGTISQLQMEDAIKQPITLYLHKDLNQEYAPYYVEYIRKYILDKYGKEALYHSGLTVKSPIDSKLAKVSARAMREGLMTVDKRQGYRGALKKAKSQDDQIAALKEINEFNIQKKYNYKILLPDASLSYDLNLILGKDKNELEILEENEIYQGLVTQVDDSKKEVLVNLGVIKGYISLDKMRWAQLVKAPSSTGTEQINRPSQALQKGDVILVRVISKTLKNGLIPLALEQEPLVQGALVSLDVNTGEVLAMVGGYSFEQSEFNRAIQAERQMGSVYKPVIYSAAVDKGYTAATIIQDSPLVLDAGDNDKWKPENFEEKFYGDTIFRSALVRSRNIPTIKIVQDIQIPYLIEYSKRLGLPDKFNADLSIALGSSTVSLMDVVRVYSVFPRGGRKVKPIFINAVYDRNQKVLEENQPAAISISNNVTTSNNTVAKPVRVAGELQAEINQQKADNTRGIFTADANDPDRVMDPRTAYVMTHIMNEVATVGTGHEAKNLGRPAAGKTGTTNDYQDAWFVGFTQNISSGVWVGFDTQKTIAPKATGAMIALPIWLEYMKEAVKKYPETDFIVPKGVNFSFIDSRNGKPSQANRPNAIREAFIEGTEPSNDSNSLQQMNSSKNQGTTPSNDEDFYKEDIQ